MLSTPLVNDDPISEGLWLSVSELARERGISKVAVSQQLSRWAAKGVAVATRRSGRIMLVNVAEFDTARGAAGDQARQQGAQTKRNTQTGRGPADPVYSHEQARRAAYEADLKRLELEEKLGQLIRVDDLERACASCAEAMVRAVERSAFRADELAGAMMTGDRPAARAFLKALIHDLRQQLADEIAKLPAVASSSTVKSDNADAGAES